MAYLVSFWNQFIAIAGAACPELLRANGGGGIRRRGVQKRIELDKMFTGNKLPFATVEIGRAVPARYAVSANQSYRELTICYFRRGGEDLDSLMGRLEALRDAFQHELRVPSLTVGQVIEVPEPEWDDELPDNKTILDKQLDMWSGQVRVTVLLGQGGNV